MTIDHLKNRWRPASWVPAQQSKVGSLKDWLIRPNGEVH
jgi:hypothetical protein